MSLWSWRRAKNKNLIGVIDVGSDSVGGALVLIDQKREGRDCAEIIATVRRELPVNSELVFDQFFAALTKKLTAVIGILQKVGQGAPSAWHLFLASPFYASQTRIIQLNYDQSVKITKELVQAAVTKDLASFQAAHPDNVVVESKIMRLTLNGYELPEPYDERAKEVAISHLVSLGSATLIPRLQELVSGAVHHRQIIIHSFALAVSSLFRNLTDHPSDFILVDATGELTDILVVAGGVLVENTSFPFGESTLIRNLTKSDNTVAAAVRSKLALYTSNQLADSARANLEKLLSSFAGAWQNNLAAALSRVLPSVFMPEKIWLLASPDLAPLFTEWLTVEPIKKLALSGQPLSAELVSPRLFRGLCLGPAGLPTDLSLLLESLFCDTIINYN